MSKKIQELLRYCEENCDNRSRIKIAVTVCVANPDAPQPYAHVTAYRMLLTAVNNRTTSGEPDWYAVLGINKDQSSKTLVNSIKRRCSEIVELLEGENEAFKARVRVYDLVGEGLAELMNEDKRRASDLRSGFSVLEGEFIGYL